MSYEDIPLSFELESNILDICLLRIENEWDQKFILDQMMSIEKEVYYI